MRLNKKFLMIGFLALLGVSLVACQREKQKLVCFGDSVTEGAMVAYQEDTYPQLVGKDLNAEVVQMGMSGQTLCEGGHCESCMDDIDSIPTDADVVIVALGLNDWDQAVADGVLAGRQEFPLGTNYYMLGEKGTEDTSTIRGAVAAYCQRIEEHLEKEDATIYFMTPLICGWNRSLGIQSQTDYDAEQTNIHGFTQEEMTNAIIDVCKEYDVEVIDLYHDTEVNESNAATYYTDGIHPNEKGHRVIADEIIRVLQEKK